MNREFLPLTSIAGGAPPCPRLALWIGSRQSLGRNPYGYVNPKKQIDWKTHGGTNFVPHPSCE
jgi:hypothetical protein